MPVACRGPRRPITSHAGLSRTTRAHRGPRGPAAEDSEAARGSPRHSSARTRPLRCQQMPGASGPHSGARPHHLPGFDSLPTAPQPSERHSPAPSARTPKLGPDAFLRATSSWGPLALAGALSFAPMPPLSTTYFLRGWNLICHCEPRRAGATAARGVSTHRPHARPRLGAKARKQGRGAEDGLPSERGRGRNGPECRLWTEVRGDHGGA